MTALNSEERPHLRLPTSTTAAIASATTNASFGTKTLQFKMPASIFTSPASNIHAGTSGGYEEGTPPQQGSSQDGGVYAANADTIASLPSTSQPCSSTVYMHSDPLSGLSWSYQTPSTSVSSGQFTMCSTSQKFAVGITFFFLCKSNSHTFIQPISSFHHGFFNSIISIVIYDNYSDFTETDYSPK